VTRPYSVAMLNASVADLQAIERAAVAKILRKADYLQRAQGLARSLAIGRAIEALPKTLKRYLDARQILTYMGVPPLPMK
jgi:hypothetical protein